MTHRSNFHRLKVWVERNDKISHLESDKFNYEFLNSSIWVQLTSYVSRTKWLTQISQLESLRSESAHNDLPKVWKSPWFRCGTVYCSPHFLNCQVCVEIFNPNPNPTGRDFWVASTFCFKAFVHAMGYFKKVYSTNFWK